MGLQLRWRWTEPALTGATILWLSTAQAEFLRGRWISVNWRVEELALMEQDILDRRLLKLGFTAALGVP